jgi:hypothetical protein
MSILWFKSGSNHIQQSNFVRMNNQKEIHKIYLDEAIDSRLICQDLVFLFKMEGTSLFKLRNLRINERNLSKKQDI